MKDMGGGDYYGVDEALVEIGFGKFQVFVLVYAGFGSSFLGMEAMIVSFIGPSVKSEWNLSSMEESLLTTVIFVGILIGAYLWGFVSDNYGRRKGLLSIAVVTSGAAFLTALAPNYISLLILRFLVGTGVGGGPVYASWFLEFVPAPTRGTWMVIFSSFWTIGTIIEASLAWIIMPRFGWRWLLALSSIPAFVLLLFYGLTTESPRYLCMKGQTERAHQVLKRVAEVNQTQLPSGILLSDRIPLLDEQVTAGSSLLSPQSNLPMVSNTGLSTLWMLFSSSLLRTTLLLWVIFFANSFTYYGIILLTSVLSSGQSPCSSLNLNSVNSHESSYRDILVASFAEIPGVVFSAFIVDKIGRKRSMEIMFVMSFMFLLPLFLHQNEILMTISLSGARMFITGTTILGGVYAPEIYPTSVRASGYGLATAIGAVGGMLSPFVAVVLLNGCHQTSAIILFETVIMLSALCVSFFPLETKGKDLSENVSVI